MSIERVEVLVEEPSTREVLEALLPRAFAGPAYFVHEHAGKDDLLAKLPARLRGYADRARSELPAGVTGAFRLLANIIALNQRKSF